MSLRRERKRRDMVMERDVKSLSAQISPALAKLRIAILLPLLDGMGTTNADAAR